MGVTVEIKNLETFMGCLTQNAIFANIQCPIFDFKGCMTAEKIPSTSYS